MTEVSDTEIGGRRADWDPFGTDALSDPPSSWRGLRDGCPVAWVERMGGFWLVSRYADVVDIARASERFNNSGGPQFGTSRPPLEVDRPEHAFFRRVLQPYFARERVEALEPQVRAYVAEMLAPLIEAGEGDMAEALTYPLPARTLCLWLGLPDDEWAHIKGVSEELFRAEEGRGDDPATRERCNQELYDFSRRLVRERIERPRDPEVDIISGIYGLTDGTNTVTEETCVEIVRLLHHGRATTRPPADSATRSFASRSEPEIQRRLRAEPDLIPSAIEEFLRLETPVQAMPRWPNEDIELHGRDVARGRAGDALLGGREPRPGAVPRPRSVRARPQPRTSTSPSAAASTAASASISRGSRFASRSRSCSAGRPGSSWRANRSAPRSSGRACRSCRSASAQGRSVVKVVVDR